MEKTNQIVLEASANPHVLNAEIESVEKIDNCMVIKTKEEGIVSHGEHGTLKTESKDIIKYTQQEYNPVTKAMQNAFD